MQNTILIFGGSLLSLLLLIAGSHFLVSKKFHAETHIQADPKKVWSFLVDESKYKEWNSVLIPINKNITQGKKIKYEMTDHNNKKSTITIKVKKMIPKKELNQVGGIPGILTFNHRYTLEPTKNGTKLIQYEIDRGIALLFWDSSWVESAYQKSGENLKILIEQN